ncbi:MAG: DUF2341 domain-containing protein [Planctomycetes bacterium]|nr:DUF2341 domain-containing protein [Planctomycetota bacterium]
MTNSFKKANAFLLALCCIAALSTLIFADSRLITSSADFTGGTFSNTEISGNSVQMIVPADTWWNSSYAYRKAITIDNQNGTSLSDYQVKVINPVYDETGLVGSWNFDEGLGTAVADTSGNSNNGTLSGTPTWSAGKFGNGISFNGNSDVMAITSISCGSAYTIETWFSYPQPAATGGNTLTRGVTFDHQVYVEPSAKQLGVYDNQSGTNFRGSGFYMTSLTNGWHHLVASASGSSTVFYIDGSVVGTSPFKSSAQISYIGNYQGGSQQFGTIDEVRIYNRTLLIAEIKAHYNAKAKLNYGDSRFTNASGTELPYWLEKDGTFWVKISGINSLPLNSLSTIYMYYGNPSASFGGSYANNGTNTFDFFDDFTGSSIDVTKWQTTGTPAITISNSNLNLQTDGSSGMEYISSLSFTTSPGVAIRTKQKDSTASTYPGEFGFGVRNNDTTANFAAKIAYSADQYCMLLNDGSAPVNGAAAGNTDDNNWHIWDIFWRTTEAKLVQDNITKETVTTGIPSIALGVAIGAPDYGGPGTGSNTTYTDMDWFLVRKYSVSEPSTIVYAEQENIVYGYTKSITLNNTTGSILTNFQVKITANYSATVAGEINLQSRSKSDFSDVRFGDSTGKMYPYWRESWTYQNKAVFWVKLPSISTGGITIYAYYGNSSATDTGSGAAVFDFFEGFDGYALDTAKWTSSGTITANPGFVTISSGGYIRSNATANSLLYNSALVLEGSLRHNSTTNSNMFGMVTSNYFGANEMSATAAGMDILRWTTNNCFFERANDSNSGTETLQGATASGAFNRLKIKWVQGSSISYEAPNNSGGIYALSVSDYVPSASTLYMHIDTMNASTPADLDFIFVRKYALADPAITATGTESPWNATANAWQQGSTYRITNANATILRNHQISLTIDTATLISQGFMNIDCSDIRFASTADFREQMWGNSYPYWIESGINTSTTKIWVRVDTIPASSTKDIYMFYQNPAAPSRRSGAETFEFFDDFENYVNTQNLSGTNRWSATAGTFTASNTYTVNGALSGKWYFSGSSSANGTFWDFNERTSDFVLEYNYRRQTRGSVLGTVYDTTPNWGSSMLYDSTSILYYRNSGGGDTAIVNPFNAAWYRIKESHHPASKTYDLQINNGTTYAGTALTYHQQENPRYFKMVTDTGSALTWETYVDDIFVRKYAAIEPSTAYQSALQVTNSGTYVSPRYEITENPASLVLDSVSYTATGTGSLTVYFRASDTDTDFTSFTDDAGWETLDSSPDSSIASQGKYFQFKTSHYNPGLSTEPKLDDFTLDYSPNPTAISATVDDIDIDNSIDTVTVTFSEPITGTTSVTNGTGFSISGYSIASGALTSADTITFTLAESGANDAESPPLTISYDPSTGNIVDTDGTPNPVLTTQNVAMANIAVTNPIALSATFNDIDNDSSLDTVTVTFTEPVTGTTSVTNGTGFSVSGYVIVSGTLSSADTVTFTVGESGTNDVESAPAIISYNPSTGNIVDTDGAAQPLLTSQDISITNLSAPYPRILSTVVSDTNSNGQIDLLRINFSEPVTGANSVASGAGFTLMGYAIASGIAGSDGKSVFFTLTESGTADYEITPDLSYALAQGDIVDTDGSTADALQDYIAAPVSAAPVVTSFSYLDTDNNGFLDLLIFTFSKNLSSAGSISDWLIEDSDGTVLSQGLTTGNMNFVDNKIFMTLANNAGTKSKPGYTYISSGTNNMADSSGIAVYAITSPAEFIPPEEPVENMPIANAGPDQASLPAIITLDGTASSTPIAAVLSYAWTQESGPIEITLQNANTSAPYFVGKTSGSYIFRLTVGNGIGFDSDMMKVIISNVQPVADAGTNVTVMAGTLVTLNGSNSVDPNEASLTYSWSHSELLLNPDTATPGLDTTLLNGMYEFTLIVSDGVYESNPDTVTVIVNSESNLIPSANAGPDFSVIAGATVTLDSSDSVDSDGTITAYSWTQISGPESVTLTDAAEPQFIPNTSGVYEFQLIVTDDKGVSSFPDTTVVFVNSTTNNIPTAIATASDYNLIIFESVTLSSADSKDVESQSLSALWEQIAGPQVFNAPQTTADITFSPVEPGIYTFRLTVNDGLVSGYPDEISINAAPEGTTSFPAAVPIISSSVDPNNDNKINTNESPAVTLDGTASTGTGVLTYSWTQISGPTVLLSQADTATPAFSPVITGVYAFQLTVIDENGLAGTSSVTLGIETYDALLNPAGNLLPLANAGNDSMAFLNTVVYLDGSLSSDSSSDADSITNMNSGLQYEWVQTAGPLVVLNNPESYQPSFSASKTGIYTFALYVKDGLSKSFVDEVTVTVVPGTAGGGDENTDTGGNKDTTEKTQEQIGSVEGPGCFIKRLKD